MPAKIKILLFTMIAASGLIVFSVFGNIKNASNLEANIGQAVNSEGNGQTAQGTNQANVAPGTAKKSDIDQDGLPDEEEPLYRTDPLNKDTDGDGFWDGEEVAAGCSPLVPKPNDCGSENLNSSSKSNLTEYFSFLIMGGVPLENMDQTNPEVEKYIESLSDEALRIKKALLSIDDSDIKVGVSEDGSKTAYQNYLNELGKTLEKYLSKNKERINVADLDNLYNELSKLEPSPDLADFHKKLLKFFVKLRVYVSNLNEEKEDPAKALLTLESTDDLLDEYEKIRTEIRAVIVGSPSGTVVPVNDEVLIKLLNEIHKMDSTARERGREALQTISDYIINVIIRNMGRKGQIQGANSNSNFFVQNWRNFGLEGQYRAEDLWRGLLYTAAYGDQQLQIPPLLCDHIRNSPAFRSLLPREVDNLIQSKIQRRVDTLQEYLTTTKCDSFVNENYETFLQDFAAGGGWDMLEKLAQPQNNIFGAIDLAMDELERQKQVEQQADTNEVLSGSGYLGRKQCLSSGPGGQCVIWGPTDVPSDLVVATLAGVINQNLAFIADISRRDDATINSELSRISEYFSNKNNGLIPRIFGFTGF